MGAPAPNVTVMPTPSAGLPTNAGFVAVTTYAWTIHVLHQGRELPTRAERLNTLGDGSPYDAVFPEGAWPAGAELEVLARMVGVTPATEVRRALRTAAGPTTAPPTCAWRGPIAPSSRRVELPPGAYPTNMPMPDTRLRDFALPAIGSGAGYVVRARVYLVERRGAPPVEYEGTVVASAGASVGLLSSSGKVLSDDARIVGLTLTDLAGNSAHFGGRG